MATIFMMNEEIARGMVCFFHQKKHSYLINFWYILWPFVTKTLVCCIIKNLATPFKTSAPPPPGLGESKQLWKWANNN
jgi:hypothetical protein